jgi:hypothetical protein
MKKISIIPFLAIAALLIIVSCKKGVFDYGDTVKMTGDQAALRINYVSQYANNRAIVIKINDKAVNTPIIARTPFPGGGYNTGGGNTADFLLVTAGTVKVSIVQPKKIYDGTDSLVLYTTTFQLEAGKNYVAHITDTAATTKSILTTENLTRPDTATCRLHFVNLIPNVAALDLYYGTATASDQSTDSLLISNLPYLENSPDFLLKIAGANKTFKIRAAGAAKTSATVIASYSTTSVPANQRVFTAFASGYNGKVSPSTQRPYISFFLVR